MPIFYSFSRCKNLAEKGTFCGKWKIAIAQRKHKNAQTIIIIIIPRQYFGKKKGCNHGVQNHTKDLHVR
jgi:hypothetical protein